MIWYRIQPPDGPYPAPWLASLISFVTDDAAIRAAFSASVSSDYGQVPLLQTKCQPFLDIVVLQGPFLCILSLF